MAAYAGSLLLDTLVDLLLQIYEVYIISGGLILSVIILFSNTPFFISNTFRGNTSWNWLKIKQSQEKPWVWTFALGNLLAFIPHSHQKVIQDIVKSWAKQKCFCFNEIIWLVIKKMKVKIENRSHRYDINRARSKHGPKHSKYKSVSVWWCLHVTGNN